MRTLIFSALLILAGVRSAHATFDLMYLPQQNGGIIRYDPVNRVQLGVMPTPSDTHSVFYSGGQYGVRNRIYRMDFFAGNSAGDMPIAIEGIEASGVRAFDFSDSTGSFVNLSNRLTIVQALAGASDIMKGQVLPNGNIVTWSGSTGDTWTFKMFTPLGAPLATSTYTHTHSSTSGVVSAIQPIIFQNRQGRSVFSFMVKKDLSTGGTHLFRYGLEISGNTFYRPVERADSWVLNANTEDSAVALAPAHHGSYVVISHINVNNDTYIGEIGDNGVGDSIGSHIAPFEVENDFPSAFHIGMVVAPEPAPFAVLGLGVLALMRRRRRR